MSPPAGGTSGGGPPPGSSGPGGRILFIAGWGRSGSTLLDRMIGQLPGVVSVGEIRAVWQRGLVEDRLCGCGSPFSECEFWSAVGEQAFGGWGHVDLSRVTELRRNLDRPWRLPFLLAPRLSPARRRLLHEYGDLLRRLYGAIGSVSGADVIVDSSKISTQAILLRRCGLHPRAVHLVRDSRGVLYSWAKQVERPDTTAHRDFMIEYGALTGSVRYIVYNLMAQLLPLWRVPYLRVRYEDLIAAPVPALERVARHAGLALDPQVAAPLASGLVALRPNHTVDGNPMRFQVGTIRLRVDDAWRRHLPAAQRRLVTALTAPLLRAYGYPLGHRAVPPAPAAAGAPAAVGTADIPDPRRASPAGTDPARTPAVADTRDPAGSADEWPAVSVVIPTRDRAELLQRALESALGQDYRGDVEVVVVFDRQDPTFGDLEAGPGRTVRVLRNDRTPGAAGARNTGISKGIGELVAFCDDDDVWLPDKLRLQVQALRRHPNAIGAATGFYIDYRDSEMVRRPLREVTTHQDLLRSRVAVLHPSTVLFPRTRLLDEVGLVDEGLPGSYAEDYDLMLRATKVGDLVAVPEPLVRVYWHDGSWFTGDWATIVAAIEYLLVKHPDFSTEPRGLARLYGRLAFAKAALGERTAARSYAVRAIRLHAREKRPYLAYAVSTGLLPAKLAMRIANVLGKGI